MKRAMISIDESVARVAGDCIPNCPEGALQVIDGKARVVSDLPVRRSGSLVGHCPKGR